ncbi:flagella basal body P-ring formation protein FlgA [Poseidonocella pacifica]|uniref:Flagella basal body P-ring formation protein FlgA n=1 Tax=Poseidonocella pacifica TaxID=871651 RepID=A0A1I0XWF9_9RHOB|nr:flagellar basal body P-ring formation chaperone FlgA [Poseidonocella pacifica]SFB05405.1 flagella basal body P-ring formation protein FlgA [Poseidonocella pacifica]
MRAVAISLLLALAAGGAVADTLYATVTLRPGTIVGPGDFEPRDVAIPGMVSDARDIVGLETRVAIYAGRPVRPGDFGPPTIIERNDVLTLNYRGGGLRISTEGRALSQGGVGDVVRVMNLSSRSTVTGIVQPDGTVEIQR